MNESRETIGKSESGLDEGKVRELIDSDNWSLENSFREIDNAVEALKRIVLARGWESEEIEEFVEVAFREALVNALIHGNYGLTEEDKGEAKMWDQALAETTNIPAGNIEVEFTITHDEIRVSIEDHGMGFNFNTAEVSAISEPKNIMKKSGRGLLLIKHFADEVFHEKGGRRIILIKRK